MTNDFKFMTYKKAAECLKIAPASVKRQATRNKWPKKNGNEGLTLVGIPISRFPPDSQGDNHGDCHSDINPIHELQKRIAILETELSAEQRRADKAEKDILIWQNEARDWKTQALNLSRPWWKKIAG